MNKHIYQNKHISNAFIRSFVILLVALTAGDASLMAQAATEKTASNSSASLIASTKIPKAHEQSELTIVTVDLPVLFTFHPAMRNFDYRSGKFVSQVPYTPPEGGLKAWNKFIAQRKAIAELESAMEQQLGKVNAEMAANSRPPDPNSKIATSPSWVEYQKYAEMAQEHRRLLTELTQQTLGGFPESLLGGLPESDLKRIAQEIFTAVEEEAKANKAAFVINLPTFGFGNQEIYGTNNQKRTNIPISTQPLDPLDKWQIRKLQDLENLLQQASGSSPLPFGKPIPQKNPNAWCGGHFESIKDPVYLNTLAEEYFNAREIFCRPFENLGVYRRILKGTANFHEKDITIEALSRLFDLYKTRQLEREVITKMLRRHRGG